MTSPRTPVCSVPSVAPGGLRVSRSPDGLSMNISWSPLTLSQARGFVDYVIVYGPVVKTIRQGQISVTTNMTSVVVSGLEPSKDYSVTVRVQTKNGILGPISNKATSPSVPVSGGTGIV